MAEPASPETRSAARSRRRGPRKGDLREAAIVDTLARLLGEQRTFSSLGVDELAQGAGISRSAFYFYFDSREAVLRALSDRVSRLVFDASDAWLNRTDHPPAEALRNAVAAYVDLWDEHGAVLRAILTSCAGDPELQAFWATAGERFVAAAAAQIKREREAGVALAGPPSAIDLATVLCAMTERAAFGATQPGVTARARKHLTDTLATVWHRAIYGTPNG